VESLGVAPVSGAGFARPYVVSWNLTYRCNLACEHCYLDAGGKPEVADAAFADRSELTTQQCREVIDQLADFAPECLTILTGGEPLLRRDILDIVGHAHARGLWVVVGTNGVKVTEHLARVLLEAGVRGMSLSLDALDPAAHDAFRRVRGAWQNTVEGAKVLHRVGLPFIVQTTVARHNAAELPAIAAFARHELGAKVWNLYFLVPTGRGTFVSDLSPAEYDGILAGLSAIRATHAGAMVVNAKCAPHHVRHLLAEDATSSLSRTYDGGAGGCPAGTHYMGIRPNGDVTPCPYLPVFGGNLRQVSLAEVWNDSQPFTAIRRRDALGGRCGACELHGHCGGCRARAWAETADLLAEDPLCTHVPGTFPAERIAAAEGGRYGEAVASTIVWDDAATARMTQVPAFVRGMVVRAVEGWCRSRGVTRVTEEALAEIRAKMPTPKVFKRGTG
jgi:radical SAM protein with 4Fe4S-binding SPASM domain